MHIKRLITASMFVVGSVSATQAADVTGPQTCVGASAFSWSGFYVGGKLGGFSSKIAADILSGTVSHPMSTLMLPGVPGLISSLLGKMAVDMLAKTANQQAKTVSQPVHKDKLPELSSIIGGLYAGSNIDFGKNFILGIDMDMVWSGKKNAKTHAFHIQEENRSDSEKKLQEIGYKFDKTPLQVGDEVVNNFALQKKWAGATRARVGFAFDRFMPYVVGGVSYAQLQEIVEVSLKRKGIDQEDSVNISDEAKMMLGYTFGVGIDYAMTKNAIMRAEYRYSDLGKKKVAEDKMELAYKTNDLRVGVAYKF
ncbi:outer membrane protein [Bartonella sp. A05]|uniref:outer membrane protein n=1 Tax=Bartonella sp. A05 TaxID=2967261 RepID=UPI0022A9770B|nr:outer membrane protein [Bartonella sp. A05]MCZ2203686.1 porin family protein [Bartonella sp. A05]